MKKMKLWRIILIIVLLLVVIGGFVVYKLYSSITGSGGDLSTTITDKMLSEAKAKFIIETYEDAESGLSISCNIYIPEDYDESKEYPLMVFIADSSSVGNDVTAPLSRNVGGAIWATVYEQSKHPSFVVVPCYPEGILDDHGTYTMTGYVEATAKMIQSIEQKYSIDLNRVYGSGQSMGAMTTMYLAANHPDLYTAILIVDGQWNIEELEGLKDVTFTYFAAGGDAKASAGQQEVKDMFNQANIAYGELIDLNAQADVSELNPLAEDMYSQGYSQNFITWKTGTVGSSLGGDEHMASFKYGFKIDVVRDWIYQQSK